MKKIRLVEWFGGIGASTKAIDNLGIDYEVVDYVELDKHAVKSYNAIHGTNFVPRDIKDVDTIKYGDIDILIAGWPCQDLSIAGKGLGIVNGDRSSLIFLTLEKLKEMVSKPRYILLENVKGLLSDKHIDDFKNILQAFNEIGYNYDYTLLNAKHFGIPQNRERVFILLTRKDLEIKYINNLLMYRDKQVSLKDILDFSVPTYKHISNSNDKVIYIKNLMKQYNGKIIKLDIAKLNNQNPTEINKVGTLGTIENSSFEKLGDTRASIIGVDGVGLTVTTRSIDGSSAHKIMFKEISFNQDKTFTGVDGLTNTLIATSPDFKSKIIYTDSTIIHYRKLTASECLMLMGFTYLDFIEMSQVGVSDSQICKQAGNSIVVNVLVEIFREVFNGIL